MYPGFNNLNQTSYNCEVYKVTIDHYHDLMDSEVIDAWARNSSSRVMHVDTLENDVLSLNPFPDVKIEYIDEDHAIISAYVVKILPSGLWYPMQVSGPNIKLNYTVYTAGGFTGIDEATLTLPDFTVYPNPNTGTFTLNMPLLREGICAIKMYDMSGRLVHTDSFNAKRAGIYRPVVSVNELAAGIYILEATTPDHRFTVKIRKE